MAYGNTSLMGIGSSSFMFASGIEHHQCRSNYILYGWKFLTMTKSKDSPVPVIQITDVTINPDEGTTTVGAIIEGTPIEVTAVTWTEDSYPQLRRKEK